MADNFTPGETITLAAGTSSTSTSFTLAQSSNYPDCMVTNAGSQIAFVGFAAANASANQPGAGALNAIPVLANESLILRKGIGAISCAAVTPTGTTTLYFTAGEGN